MPTGQPNANRRRWGRGQWDHAIDTYKFTAKPHEPVKCPSCGAAYHGGRWQWSSPPVGAQSLQCPACHRIADKYPAGVVTLTGPYVAAHKDELLHIVRHQETAEKPDHPMNRIIAIEETAPDRLEISTTDIHLPRRIGEALKRSHHGELTMHFDEHGYFVRVNWHGER